MCLYSSVNQTTNQAATALVKRLITLALELEVEVGQFVIKGLKRELPQADKELIPLLKSNAADEARHFQGFQYAAETYGYSNDKESEELSQAWVKLAESESTHPIHIAGLVEVSVFLISLGLLRIVGSPSLSKLAMEVAKDENRHVKTNQAVSGGLGLWGQPSRYQQDLIDTTLEWVWGEGLQGVSVPKQLNLDNLKKYSRELVTNLHSPEFDSLTRYSYHHLPFELPNDYLYTDRELE